MPRKKEETSPRKTHIKTNDEQLRNYTRNTGILVQEIKEIDLLISKPNGIATIHRKNSARDVGSLI
jgi:hypothetical protein